MAKTMEITLAYLQPNAQWLQSVTVNLGCTIHQVLNQINFFSLFPELNVRDIDLGVFGIKKQLSDVLKPNDRIEIYRPLLCNPKQARRERTAI